MQPAVSICGRRVARTIVNAGTRNQWVHFRRTAEEKAAVKEELLRFGPLPGVIGYVDGSFVALGRGIEGALLAPRRETGLILLLVFPDLIADMPILALDPLRLGSDDDSNICVGPGI
ncbi:hypothetical protein MRX96_014230 [Rhipicephalus microplus]